MNTNKYQNINTLHINEECSENDNGNMKCLDHIKDINYMTLRQGQPSSVSAQETIGGDRECILANPKKESDNGTISNIVSKWPFWSSVILFAISSFLAGVSVSMMSPFYTKEARQKGVTVSQAGLVFGCASFIKMVFIPIFGMYINKLRSYRLFTSSLLVCGAGSISFGLLQWINDKQSFLALSFIFRIIIAIGQAGFVTSLFPLATKTTGKKYEGRILSLLESTLGIGLTTGPTIGGILYDYKGFCYPFVLVGGMRIFPSIILSFIIEKLNRNIQNEEHEPFSEGNETNNTSSDTSYYKLITSPVIAILFIMLALSEMSNAWVQPTLEPFLNENFNMTSTMSGIIFGFEGLTYAVFSPVFGILLDSGVSPFFIMLFGVVFQILGLSLIGPAKYIDFIPNSPYTIGVGLCVLGSGVASSYIVTLLFMFTETFKFDRSIKDTEQTKGMITSVWLIAEQIGRWLGSFLGGVAYETLGFENGTGLIIGFQGPILIGIPYLYYHTRCRNTKTEQEVLINKE